MPEVSLIGTGGMLPLYDRYLTSLVIRYNGSMLLIDCGEGTQVTLNKLGWGFKNIDYILFTHFHADHIAGIPGLLLTLGNHGRTEPLTIIGPAGIAKVINSLRVIAPEILFEIKFIEIAVPTGSGKGVFNFTAGEFDIEALPLDHRIECYGYNVSVKRQGKFDVEKAQQNNVPMKLWSRLQKGETADFEGVAYTPDMVLGPVRKGVKISYITDTRPIDTIPDFVRGSDLFICEGLYGDDDMREKAQKHMHMIFSEAAQLAKMGEVTELWLTHYSQAMRNPQDYVEGVKNIFQNTIAGYDRISKEILFEND